MYGFSGEFCRLLIARLEAYGFSENTPNYIQSYLRNHLQRTNVNNNFRLWKDIFAGVPQGSILGPPMFNRYINDIFLFTDDVCLSNYADDIGENFQFNWRKSQRKQKHFK